MIFKIPDRQFLGGFFIALRSGAKGEIMFLQTVLAIALAAPAYARTLHIGGQSVALTPDKRSSPALAVQIPGDGIWYGFLMPGTAPGRLTVQMPGGGIFSLIESPPTNHTFSTILADFPQVWTWDVNFRNAHTEYNDTPVWFTSEFDNSLATNAVWPTYHVQAMCSNTAGTPAQPGSPVHANNGIHCWCRLKRRADGANGGWVFMVAWTEPYHCANGCPRHCAAHAAVVSDFRAALLSAFANP